MMVKVKCWKARQLLLYWWNTCCIVLVHDLSVGLIEQRVTSDLLFMFQAMLNGFFSEFPQDVKSCTSYIVDAAVEIYFRMSTDLLPTPAKSHYVFNLRDLSKCIQGGHKASRAKYMYSPL